LNGESPEEQTQRYAILKSDGSELESEFVNALMRDGNGNRGYPLRLQVQRRHRCDVTPPLTCAQCIDEGYSGGASCRSTLSATFSWRII
jgi:hypothetical protein